VGGERASRGLQTISGLQSDFLVCSPLFLLPLWQQARLSPGSSRLPKDNPIIIIERNAKALEIGNQITRDRVDISMMHGNTGQILRRDTTLHVDFVLT
jgi:hypothetical protein